MNESMNIFRLRKTSAFEEWISRCEEMIKALDTSKIDTKLVQKVVDAEQTKHFREKCQMEDKIYLHNGKDEIETILNEQSMKLETEMKRKKSLKSRGKVLKSSGKLEDDLAFLDNLIKHPALQNHHVIESHNEKERKQFNNRIIEVRKAAIDGFKYLEERQHFWEASKVPSIT